MCEAVTGAKRRFSRYAIALLGIVSAYPLDATYAGQETIDKEAAHVLLLKARTTTKRASTLTLRHICR